MIMLTIPRHRSSQDRKVVGKAWVPELSPVQ